MLILLYLGLSLSTLVVCTSIYLSYNVLGSSPPEERYTISSPPEEGARTKYFSWLRPLRALLKMSVKGWFSRAPRWVKTLDRFSIELWNNGRYKEAYWLREEIQRIKMLMLKKD